VKHPTAAAAHLHLQPFPGSDAALAFAIAHVLRRDGKVDRAFLAAHAIGWEELEPEIARCSPEWAAPITGVPAAEIEEAARLFGTDRVILIPDEFLARNVARQTDVGIIAWKGRCEVHERFTAADIVELKAAYPDAEVLAHPECPAEVLEVADFAGSTAAMNDYVLRRRPKRVVLITECSMADNVAADAHETEFVRPCNLCPHMKRITLENIYDALLHGRHEVTVDPAISERARLAVQRMVDLPPPAKPARYDLIKARHHVDVELI